MAALILSPFFQLSEQYTFISQIMFNSIAIHVPKSFGGTH